MRQITVNLATADLKKEGPSYDLPIAVGILIASGQVEADTSGVLYLGELSLDGSLRHSPGIIALVALARERGLETAYVPAIDARETTLPPVEQPSKHHIVVPERGPLGRLRKVVLAELLVLRLPPVRQHLKRNTVGPTPESTGS